MHGGDLLPCEPYWMVCARDHLGVMLADHPFLLQLYHMCICSSMLCELSLFGNKSCLEPHARAPISMLPPYSASDLSSKAEVIC